MRSRTLLTALVVLGCLIATAQATVIYQDNFNRNMSDGHGGTTSAPLNGSTPYYASGAYGGSSPTTWLASNWYTSTNSGGYGDAAGVSGYYDAWLPCSIQAGYIYTSSVNVQQYSGGSGYGDPGRYFALGYCYAVDTPNPSNPFYTYSTAYAVEKTGPSSSESFDLGQGQAYVNYHNSGSPPLGVTYTAYSQSQMSDLTFHTLKIVLDTTHAAWRVSSYLDSATTPYATYTYGTSTNGQGQTVYNNPVGDNYIGFSCSDGASVTVENFKVSVTPMLGDANWDGSVDGTDLGIVLAHYNKTGAWEQGDFNGDGSIDGSDLGVVLANYNKTVGQLTSAVPEPGALLLAATGLIGLLAYAWRKRK